MLEFRHKIDLFSETSERFLHQFYLFIFFIAFCRTSGLFISLLSGTKLGVIINNKKVFYDCIYLFIFKCTVPVMVLLCRSQNGESTIE